MPRISISILIPVFNAENTIELLCRTLITLYCQKYDLQIVLVNDYSRDNSDAICKKLYFGYPSVITYIRLSKNFGEHNAVMAGLNHATGDYCVIMDDDLQNPPEEVEKLVEEIRKGYDVVYSRYAVKKDSWFRRLGSSFNDKVATLVLRKPAGLYLSSFKAVNRFLTEQIKKCDCPDPYIDGVILMSTDNIGTVEVMHRERVGSKSGYTLGKLVSLWGNMVVNFSLLPLRIAGIIGLILLLSGVLYGFHKAFDDIYLSGALSDYETLISLNMIFRGIVLLSIGIVGEYVGRIYLSLNGDPQYVIRETFSSGRRAEKAGSLTSIHDAGRRYHSQG